MVPNPAGPDLLLGLAAFQPFRFQSRGSYLPFRILAMLIIAVSATFQGCLFSSGNDGTGIPKGFRRPNAPEPRFATEDSLVSIQIHSRRTGEEAFYWIYRDGTLLDQPDFRPSDSGGPGVYSLLDSVPKPATYTYTVKYGEHRDTLSDPSKPFVFKYTGPSQSGKCHLALGPEWVEINHKQGRHYPLRSLVIERRIGTEGPIFALDTLDASPGSPYTGWADTTWFVENAWVYYRAVGMGLDESWLEPSPWDSVEVKKTQWSYIPQLLATNNGTDVEIRVANPLAEASPATYILYRNVRSARDGGLKVDSVTVANDHPAILADIPKPGVHWYWVEVRDGRGRTSARSNPVQVLFTGRPSGPSIFNLGVGSVYISFEFNTLSSASANIVERTQDTTRPTTFVRLDTLLAPESGYQDRPPKNGYWHYRVTAQLVDGGLSEPGPWTRSAFYVYSPIIQPMDARIVNQGDRVEAAPEFSMDGVTYVLYRSAHPAGRDSTPVDTLRYSHFSSFLPSLMDRPPVGIWYYRLIGYPGQDFTGEEFRSPIVRIEFNGQPAGPEIFSATIQSAYVTITFRSASNAIAYVLERAPDGSGAWTTIDTLPSNPAHTLSTTDRPPSDGYWNYRMRSILQNLSLSSPGASRRTSGPWSEAGQFSNTLVVNLVNGGTYIQVSGISTEFQYTYFLLRSKDDGFRNGAIVDSLPYGSFPATLNDAPARGTYYYWVERRYTWPGSFPMTILRSMPEKVVFSGMPEIGSVSQNGNTIRIALPPYPAEESIELLRSIGKADDPGSYVLIAEGTGGAADVFVDQDLDDAAAAFYHYKLILIREGKRLETGAVKSIYFVPR